MRLTLCHQSRIMFSMNGKFIHVFVFPTTAPEYSAVQEHSHSHCSLSIKHMNTMVSKPVTSSFDNVIRCQVLLEKEISNSIQMFPAGLETCLLTLVLMCLTGQLTCLNLEYMKVSLFELNYRKQVNFSLIFYFFRMYLYIRAVFSSNDFYSSHFLRWMSGTQTTL